MICTKCKSELIQCTNYCPNCGKKLTSSPRKPKRAGNGTGSAYRRGSTWTAEAVVGWRPLPPFDPENPDNKKQRVPIKRTRGGFKTRNEALAYIPILKNEKPDKVPALEDYWAVYEAGDLAALSPSKRTAYKIAWRKLEPLHRTRVDQITVSDLRRTVSAACPTHYPAKDCKDLLSRLFELAAAEGRANRDLPSYIRLPELVEKEREHFSETEQAALWKLYESGDIRAAIPLLLIYTGIMPGEAMKLRTDQIDLQSRTITGAGIKTKVRKATPIVLAETIVPVLQDLMDHAQPSGCLWKQVEKAWYDDYYAALSAAGCRRLTPYCCRHTTATALAVTEGIAPQTIRKVMRWSTTRMLDHYAHPDQDDALAAVDSIGKKHATI